MQIKFRLFRIAIIAFGSLVLNLLLNLIPATLTCIEQLVFFLNTKPWAIPSSASRLFYPFLFCQETESFPKALFQNCLCHGAFPTITRRPSTPSSELSWGTGQSLASTSHDHIGVLWGQALCLLDPWSWVSLCIVFEVESTPLGMGAWIKW